MDLVGLFSIVSLSFRDALVPRLEVKREDLSRSGGSPPQKRDLSNVGSEETPTTAVVTALVNLA
jgi:hypothetical protein